MKTSEIPCSPSSGLISIQLTSQRQSKLKCWSWGIRITRTLCLATNACHHVTYWFACGFACILQNLHIKTLKNWPAMPHFAPLLTQPHWYYLWPWSLEPKSEVTQLGNEKYSAALLTDSALCYFTLRIQQWGDTNACSQKLVNMSMYTMYWQRQVQNIFSFQKAMLAQPSFLLSSECCDAFFVQRFTSIQFSKISSNGPPRSCESTVLNLASVRVTADDHMRHV